MGRPRARCTEAPPPLLARVPLWPADTSTQADVETLARYVLVLLRNNKHLHEDALQPVLVSQLKDFLRDGERRPPPAPASLSLRRRRRRRRHER